MRKSRVRMPNSPAYVNTSCLGHFLPLRNRHDMCHHFSFNFSEYVDVNKKMVSEHVYFHVLNMVFVLHKTRKNDLGNYGSRVTI